MTSHSERFDVARAAEFVGGLFDGQSFQPLIDGDLPDYLPMPWGRQVHGYHLVEPVGQRCFFEHRGRVPTHGSEVS
jgi:hypothetical protein